MRGNISSKGSVWYHNPETGESIRLFYGEEIPEGFIKGRFLFPNYPFLGNRLNEEQLEKHREIMKPYHEYWLKERRYGKYKK